MLQSPLLAPIPMPGPALLCAAHLPVDGGEPDPVTSLHVLQSQALQKWQETGYPWHLLSGVRRSDMPACQKCSFPPAGQNPFWPPVLKELELTDKFNTIYWVGRGQKGERSRGLHIKRPGFLKSGRLLGKSFLLSGPLFVHTNCGHWNTHSLRFTSALMWYVS